MSKGLGVDLIGVSVDDHPSAVEAVLAKTPVPFPVAHTFLDTLYAYGEVSVPTRVLIDANGIIRAVWMGTRMSVEDVRAALDKPAPGTRD